MQATGTFEVTLTSQEHQERVGHPAIDKRFHGDLEGSSLGEMLAARTEVKGSAGYVAIERVEGTLHGRSGAFLLQHNGIMHRGAQDLALVVIPDSATGDLAGLAGSMTIRIVDGSHSYTFDYTLESAV